MHDRGISNAQGETSCSETRISALSRRPWGTIVSYLQAHAVKLACYCAILLIRVVQACFEGAASWAADDLAARYVRLTDIGLGVFVVTPLFLLCAAQELSILRCEAFLARFIYRDRITLRLIGSTFLSALVMALLLAISGFVCVSVTSGCCLSIKELLCAIPLHGLFVTLFLLASGLLMLCIYLVVHKLQFGFALACLYALIDYVARATMGRNAATGWGLTELVIPLDVHDVCFRLCSLSALVLLLTAVMFILVRTVDLVGSMAEEREV